MGNVGNKLEGAASKVFHGIGNTVDSVEKAIGSLPSTAEHIVTHTEDTVEKIVSGTESKVESVVKTGEYSLMLPLAALGIGLAIMLGRSNSSTLENVGVSAVNRL